MIASRLRSKIEHLLIPLSVGRIDMPNPLGSKW